MPTRRLSSFTPLVVILFATAARAEPPHVKDPHKAQEAAVVKRCVEVECPKFCALTSPKESHAVTDCTKHCTPDEHCKLAFPARDNTPLQKLMQAELFAELHEVQPPHAVEPAHHAPPPSDEPPFHLHKIAPAAHAAHPSEAPAGHAPNAHDTHDTHKVAPHPSVKHPDEPDPHWTDRTTPSWDKLVHQAPPASAK